MDPFATLQVPDPSQPGPSRQHVARPVSVQPTTSPTNAQVATRKRASHQVVTSQPQQDEQPVYRDIYSHPAAVEYTAAHPRRTIPKFGPYLLLQTLGEGEFGKVKLGLHMQFGEEVAVKLIRRGNIDSAVRMSKVEREIEVLRSLKHPNIVRLYDMIETDKYIGIILEYASGGELFDHILAHRYLREKDACKLFSQLISGVWYIHQKKIVHRDLKLENLLLDRHRNVIITDFGFANRFEHRSDDLMQTSCGSPCYAAPELVISDGLYVGSAVDIWSCGVILYAMLAGYLPFDDDPANPDGDNINLLYKYIVNTPLSFPEYISADARDLLSIMLVPDPARRADLPTIMAHRWLAPYAQLFSKSVAELEQAAMELHHQKRLAYQRQMKANEVAAASKVVRSHSARTDTYAGSPSSTSPSGSRSHRYTQQAQPEYLYETSVSQNSTRRAVNSAIVLPTTSPVALDDDPFAPSPSHEVPSISLPVSSSPTVESNLDGDVPMVDAEGAHKVSTPAPSTIAPVKSSPDSKRPKGGFRHTIQVEYGESEPKKERAEVATGSPQRERPPRKQSIDAEKSTEKPLPGTPSFVPSAWTPASDAATKSFAVTPKPAAVSSPIEAAAPVVSIEVTSPPITPVVSAEQKRAHVQAGSASTGSSSSSKSRHRKGISLDKMGITKMFSSGGEQTNGAVSRSPSQSQPVANGVPVSKDSGTKQVNRRPSSVQVAALPDAKTGPALLSVEAAANGKKNRRNTLTVMVEPFRSTIKQRSKGKSSTLETPMKEKPGVPEKDHVYEPISAVSLHPKPLPKKAMAPPATPQAATASRTDIGAGFVPPGSTWKNQRLPIPASTIKASKVMQWFRSKSKGRVPADISDAEGEKSTVPSDVETVQRGATPSSYSTVNNAAAAAHLATPISEKVRSPVVLSHPQHSASAASDASYGGHSFTDRMRKQIAGGKVTLRVHHGAVDQTTITTGSPPEVMKHVRTVLEGMGIEIQGESDYKYRCVRHKRKRIGTGMGLGLRDGSGNGLAAFTMVGSAALNGVDKRGLPIPSQSSFGSTGGMLRGLLMRRQSSQVSNGSQAQPSASFDSEAPDAGLAGAPGGSSAEVSSPGSLETIYGDYQQDQGDEVRFSVELTRLDRLDDTYSLDIRRLKGNLRSYKFLYDTLRQRADLQR